MIVMHNDGQFECAFDQKDTFEEGNNSPKSMTRIAQLSRKTHHKENEAIQKHADDDDGFTEHFLAVSNVLSHYGEIKRNVLP